jgi:hypothetical protein
MSTLECRLSDITSPSLSPWRCGGFLTGDVRGVQSERRRPDIPRWPQLLPATLAARDWKLRLSTAGSGAPASRPPASYFGPPGEALPQ